MSSLPIDDTWVLIGMAILAAAAVSHLSKMWRNARYGMGGTAKSSRSHQATSYFKAWESAAASEGLQTGTSDTPLKAPRMQGRLRGLSVELGMHLRRRGRRAPDPEAINPATAYCRITARAELPFPWREATVWKFILPGSVQKGDTDEVTFASELPEGIELRGVRIDRRARDPLSVMADRYRSLEVVDGTLTVVDDVQLSRNTGLWAEHFGEWLRGFGADTRAFTLGGLTAYLELSKPGVSMELRLAPNALSTRQMWRIHLETEEGEFFEEELLRERLQQVGATVEELDTSSDGLRLQAVVPEDVAANLRRLMTLIEGS